MIRRYGYTVGVNSILRHFASYTAVVHPAGPPAAGQVFTPSLSVWKKGAALCGDAGFELAPHLLLGISPNFYSLLSDEINQLKTADLAWSES
jgi:hypothetical protein